MFRLTKKKNSPTRNEIVRLGENGYFKDLDMIIGLISTSGGRKNLSEIV